MVAIRYHGTTYYITMVYHGKLYCFLLLSFFLQYAVEDFGLSTQLGGHSVSILHLWQCSDCAVLFLYYLLFGKKYDDDDTWQIATTHKTCDKSMQRLSIFHYILSAEILWAIKVTTAHYSERSCDGAGNIFRRMFRDSHIAERFACGRTKCHYLTRFGIAPHFKNLLMQQIKDSGDVVVMFDESLNCITNRKQLDVHERLWAGRQVASISISYWS